MTISLKKNGFAFGEVVNIMMKVFNVDPLKRETFVGRLQQLQKAGIPSGANSRRGAKIRYLNWQIADLMFALDLLDVGLTPATLANNPAASAYSMGGYGFLVQASLSEDKPDLFWMINSNALAYLSNPSAAEDKPNRLDALLKGRSADNVTEALSEGPSIVINMTRRLHALHEAIREAYPDMIDEIIFYPTRSAQRED